MKKPMFLLKNINIEYIDKKYNIQSIIRDENRVLKTKITDITEKEENNYFSFLDESKKNHQCVVTMKNFLNQEQLPDSTSLHCFWDRHSFNYRPLGCPIEYVSNKIYKSYHSEITKDQYILRENITSKQLEEFKTELSNNKNLIKAEFNVDENDYYLIDGLFCSFNCCLAYIKENNTNPLYHNSEILLNKMYYDTFGSKSQPLIEAPSWRLLKNYGGHILIEDFRRNFFKVEYNDFDNVVYPLQKSKCIGFLFEKNIKL